MKRHGKHSTREDWWGVIVAGDSSRPRKDSKRINPKIKSAKRELEMKHHSDHKEKMREGMPTKKKDKKNKKDKK